MLKRIFIASLLSMLLMDLSQACTVWGAIKSNELLIGKNRDFYPGNQKFIAMNNKNKYKFFGLYGDNQYDNNYTIKMGINETGLVVFMTFASTIPLKQRTAKIPYYKVMENILEKYNKVADIEKNSKLLFQNSTPVNYIFADRNKAMICEIGLNNNYQCNSYSRSSVAETITFAQTNHYILSTLEQYNLTPVIDQQTSYFRFNKINELMKNNRSNLTFTQFINFSLNTEAVNDNPLARFDVGSDNTYQDNSIFRTYNRHPDRRNPKNPNSDQDVASMIIKLPSDNNQPIELYLRIIEKVTDLNDKNYTQIIKYSDAIATLDKAINNSSSIEYRQKLCRRDLNAKTCF